MTDNAIHWPWEKKQTYYSGKGQNSLSEMNSTFKSVLNKQLQCTLNVKITSKSKETEQFFIEIERLFTFLTDA